MNPVRVVFLGTGDAFAAGGRYQAACFVESSETSFLLDCAPTALASIKHYGLNTDAIDTVFLSHLHGDHFAGLPFLFMEYIYVTERRRPLYIVGPPGSEEGAMLLFRAMYSDTALQPLPFPLEFIEVKSWKRFSIGGLDFNSFQVPHQDDPISLGYLIQVDGRKILYSGDSGWTEDLVEQSQGTDLFICECSFFKTRLPTHIDYQRLVENRSRLGSKRIVLTHLGEGVLRRQKQIDMELAHDGLVVTI